LKQGNDEVQKSLLVFNLNVFNELNFFLLPPPQGYTQAPPAMLSQIPDPLRRKRVHLNPIVGKKNTQARC
jgi:hypothetical protein